MVVSDLKNKGRVKDHSKVFSVGACRMLRTSSKIKTRDCVIRLSEKQGYTEDGEQGVLACKDEETGKSIPGQVRVRKPTSREDLERRQKVKA